MLGYCLAGIILGFFGHEYYYVERDNKKYSLKTIVFKNISTMSDNVDEPFNLLEYIPKESKNKLFLINVYTDPSSVDEPLNINVIANCYFGQVKMCLVGSVKHFNITDNCVIVHSENIELFDNMYYLTINEM
jgi:hypothetical protein